MDIPKIINLAVLAASGNPVAIGGIASEVLPALFKLLERRPQREDGTPLSDEALLAMVSAALKPAADVKRRAEEELDKHV